MNDNFLCAELMHDLQTQLDGEFPHNFLSSELVTGMNVISLPLKNEFSLLVLLALFIG
jgi:hypothetical protein